MNDLFQAACNVVAWIMTGVAVGTMTHNTLAGIAAGFALYAVTTR